MFTEVLDKLYKIKTSNLVVIDIITQIYEYEKNEIDRICKCNEKFDMYGFVCLRDLKESLWSYNSSKINIYTFRKLIDSIKQERSYMKYDMDYRLILQKDFEDIIDCIDIGLSIDEENEVFKKIRDIFKNYELSD